MDSLVTANVRQRPVRAIVSAAGVALGVCLVMLFTGLARGMSNDLQRRSSNLKAEIIFTRDAGSTQLTGTTANLSVKYVDELLKVEGVAMAVPSIRYFSQGGKGFGFEQYEGVDWDQFAEMNEMHLVAGRAPRDTDDTGAPSSTKWSWTRRRQSNNNLSVGSTLQLFGNKPYTRHGRLHARIRRARQDVSGRDAGRTGSAGQMHMDLRSRRKDAERAVETVAQHIRDALPGNKIQFTRDVFTSIEKSIPTSASSYDCSSCCRRS